VRESQKAQRQSIAATAWPDLKQLQHYQLCNIWTREGVYLIQTIALRSEPVHPAQSVQSESSQTVRSVRSVRSAQLACTAPVVRSASQLDLCTVFEHGRVSSRLWNRSNRVSVNLKLAQSENSRPVSCAAQVRSSE
jgi:hypothetical protein